MEEINIRDFFSYLKRYVWAIVIIAIAAICGVAAYESMIKKPIYQARTTVVIAKSDESESSAVTLNDINASQKLVTTYAEIAKSELVLNQVIDNLRLQDTVKELSKNIIIKPVDETSILSITVKDPTARLSATIANEIAKVFAEEVVKIYKIENVTQLSIAAIPENPSNNTTTRDLVLAVAVAVFSVVGFAFLKFYLDDTVKQSDDIEKKPPCPTDKVPGNTLARDDDWRAFRICGQLDFSLIGVLAGISKILAANSIGIFAVSTYDTDYILTKEENFEKAIKALADAGYEI